MQRETYDINGFFLRNSAILAAILVAFAIDARTADVADIFEPCFFNCGFDDTFSSNSDAYLIQRERESISIMLHIT